MNLPQCCRRLWPLFGPLLAMCGVSSSRAADEIDDYLIRDWYETEVIVFQRSRVMEINSAERLIILDPPPFPKTMRTLFPMPDAIGAGYDLDSLTQDMLELLAAEPTAPAETNQDPAAGTLPAAVSDDSSPSLAPNIQPVLEPHPLLEFMSLVSRFEAQLDEQSYRWLPESRFLMARDARLIERRGGNRVLLHGRWLQPVPVREQPQPIFIQAGSRLSRQYQLEGVMAVTLGRFLHFRARLSYREPGMGQSPINLPVSLSERAESTPLPPRVDGHMLLNESRRMRSAKVHYLDHPKLGIIVRIDPVAFPEDLVAAFEAVQESPE